MAKLNTKPGANNIAAFEEQQKTRARYMRTQEGLEPLQLAAVLARQGCSPNRPFHVALDARRIHKLALSVSALALAQCNTGLTPRQQKRRENIAAEISTIASWYGLTAECFGDPRGYVVRLHGEAIERNGWGDGFGVA